MSPELLQPLRAATPEIRRRWEALLRIEKVSGPLANPEALVYLIPQTLEDVFAALAKGPRKPVTFAAAMADKLPGCECGNNPYLAYFISAEQALIETVVLLQAQQPAAQRRECDVAEAIHVIRTLARVEIDTFCGVCTHRGCAKGCRWASASAALAAGCGV